MCLFFFYSICMCSLQSRITTACTRCGCVCVYVVLVHRVFKMCACCFADGSRPSPQPRSTPSPGPVQDHTSLLLSSTPLDPTPILQPQTQDGPRPVQEEVTINREDSTSPVPIKPERRKKKGVPPMPAPYVSSKKITNEVCFARERERERECV